MSKRYGLFVIVYLLFLTQLILAQDASKKTFTLDDLYRFKELIEKNQLTEYRQAARWLEKAGIKEEVILDYLSAEDESESENYSKDQKEGLSNLTYRLILKLKNTGSKDSVPVIVNRMASSSALFQSQIRLNAQVLVAISCRHEIKKEDLKTLFDSADEDLSAFTESLWKCIVYDHTAIESDQKSVIDSYLVRKNGFQKKVGGYLNTYWRQIAQERGFVVKGEGQHEVLKELIQNCFERITTLQNLSAQPELGHSERGYRVSFERYLYYLALDEFVSTGKRKSFDFLTQMLKTDDFDQANLAAYHLHQITGMHFPLHTSFRNGRYYASVQLSRKASKEWEKYKKNLGDQEISIPNPRVLNNEARLSQFKRDRRRKTGAEFDRSTDEVIEEFFTTGNREILEMLATVLQAKLLSNDQVEKLIEKARERKSDTQRLFIWQVLFSANSEAAYKFLKLELNSTASKNNVLELLDHIQPTRKKEMRMLIYLYGEHDSDEIRDSIVKMGFDYDGNRRSVPKEVQNILIDWIIENSNSFSHRLLALRTIYRRSGISTPGDLKVKAALASETIPEQRKAIFQMIADTKPYKILNFLNNQDESEEIQLLLLKGYQAYITERSGSRVGSSFMDHDFEKAMPVMKALLENSSHDSVKQIAQKNIHWMRKQALSNVLSKAEESVGRLKSAVALYASKTDEESKKMYKSFLDQAVYMSGTFKMQMESQLKKLKRIYGEIPLEEITEFNKTYSKYTADYQKIIDEAVESSE